MCSINHDAIKQSAAFRDLPLVGVQRFDDESYELRNCNVCGTTLAVEEEVTVDMTLATDLSQYQADMARSRVVRHLCDDCNDVDDHGVPAGPCARHMGACVGCMGQSGAELVERDPQEYADLVGAYWCKACIESEAT